MHVRVLFRNCSNVSAFELKFLKYFFQLRFSTLEINVPTSKSRGGFLLKSDYNILDIVDG